MSFLDTSEYAKQKGIQVKEFPFNNLDGYKIPFANMLRAIQSDSIFGSTTCNQIIDHFESGSTLTLVNKQGIVGVSNVEDIGSHRILTHDIKFAQYLTTKLNQSLYLRLHPLHLNEYSPVDWLTDNPQELNYWIPLHASPVFRFMRYKKGGQHLPHYDAPFYIKENPLIRTLMSGIIYLTDSCVETRFLKDPQSKIPFKFRDHSDWTHPANEDEIIFRSSSEQGKVLLFPHQLLHDASENYFDEDRIIIRFDYFYQAIGKV